MIAYQKTLDLVDSEPTVRRDLARSFAVDCQPRIALSHREFAEKHIRLATGPYKGLPFRCDRQPFTGLLFDELDSGCWPTVFVTGPSQSSKTLSGFVIPTLRDVVELREDVLIGVPEADMAADKWDKDFLPTLRESPDLQWLIPAVGPGSKGGRIKDRVTLGNGVDLKIMTRGGQDTAKAGYTSPRIRVTEAAGWSQSSEKSDEADPLRQLKARMRSFRRRMRSLLVEGTVTVEDQLPWRARGADDDEVLISTRSVIACPCPHCPAWISPEREHLVGWKGAESEDQAANQAVFVCPACGGEISDEQRKAANADCRLVHHGQHVDEHGQVIGELPPTTTLWFRWNAFNNLLLDAADTAVDEWRAEQIEEGTQDRENAEKELCQFCHAVPFKSKLAENETIKATTIRKRTDQWGRGLLPHDTVHLTIGVDLGDWTGWWFAMALRSGGQIHVPAYGAFDIKRNKGDDLATRIVAALHDFSDSVIEEGFPQEGADGLMVPDAVWIDCGYRPDDVSKFIRERGKFWDNRYRAVRGRGKSTRGGGYVHRNRVTSKTPRIGTQWYCEPNFKRKIPEFTVNSDYWKLQVHSFLRVKIGKKGSMTFSRADMKNEHAKVSHHLANEQYRREWVPGKGLIESWVKTGDNHWLDAAVYAAAAGDSIGFRLRDIEDVPQIEVIEEPAIGSPSNFYADLLRGSHA